MHDATGVDLAQKACRTFGIVRDNGIGVLGAVMIDKVDGLGQGLDRCNRNNRRVVLGIPVLVRGRNARKICLCQNIPNRLGDTHLNAFVGKDFPDFRQERFGDSLMHQECLGGIAGGIALRLGVIRHGKSHRKVRILVHIRVADAVQVFNHRNARFFFQARDEFFSAPRNENVDVLGGCNQFSDKIAVASSDDLNGVLRKTCFGKRLLHETSEHAVAIKRFFAAAQNRCISRLKSQGRGIDCHVRARFENNRNDAERHTHACYIDAARSVMLFGHLPDRIGKVGNLFTPERHRFDNRRCQAESVDESGRIVVFGGLF